MYILHSIEANNNNNNMTHVEFYFLTKKIFIFNNIF